MLTSVLLVLLGVAIGVIGLLSLMLGFGLVYPPFKKPPGETPAAAELDFEAVELESHDGKRLSGWWLGSNLPRVPVVLLHGYTDSKSTYLGHLRFLHERGHPCVIYDHRGHGESDAAPCSLGPLEARDVTSVVDWLSERGHQHVVLWGISMGAATALLASNDDRVIGVISESSFLSISTIVADHLRVRFRMPFWPVGPLGLMVGSWLTRCRLLGVSVARAADKLEDRPLLVVSGDRDVRMPPTMGETIAMSSTRSRHLVVPGAAHADCWPMGKTEYMEHAGWLLEEAEKQLPVASARR